MAIYNSIRILGVLRYFVWGSGLPDAVISAITILSAIVLVVVPYLLGGLNFAIIISKKKFGVDVRNFGSGNAGMTNMHRTFGKKAGIITLAGDAGKTFVSCLLGYLLLGKLGAYIAGLFCMLGHMFPIKYKFKGGKGVVCVAVAVLMTDIGNPMFAFIPLLFLVLLAIFIVIVLGTKYVSLASVMCMCLYPIFLHSLERVQMATELNSFEQLSASYTEIGFYVTIAFIMAATVVFMHRENLKRLFNGQESKLDLSSFKKKPSEETPVIKPEESSVNLSNKPTKNKKK